MSFNKSWNFSHLEMIFYAAASFLFYELKFLNENISETYQKILQLQFAKVIVYIGKIYRKTFQFSVKISSDIENFRFCYSFSKKT